MDGRHAFAFQESSAKLPGGLSLFSLSGQLSPRRNIVSVAKEGPQEMAKAFREGLLPHGDDDGGPGRTGADKSSAGQMR